MQFDARLAWGKRDGDGQRCSRAHERGHIASSLKTGD